MKVAIFLAAFVCYAHANAIHNANDKTPETQEIIQDNVDVWLREFYVNCGRNWNVDPGVGLGLHYGSEMVKRCVGDRDGCIEREDCWFAVAVTERANYAGRLRTTTAPPTPTTTTTPPPTPTTPFDPPFDQWDRLTQDVRVDILDTCHLKPIDFENRQEMNKFVGVALGIFNSSNKLGCDPDPYSQSPFETGFKFENVRTYFSVENITMCDFQPSLPVHPIDHQFGTQGPILDPIVNSFTITKDDWDKFCNNIFKKSTNDFVMSDTVKDSEYLDHFLLYYYGTQDFTKASTGTQPNFTFIDNTNNVEVRGMLRIMPKNRTVIADGPSTDNGSSSVHTPVVLSLVAIATLIKSLF
jgi:hypothetical protein